MTRRPMRRLADLLPDVAARLGIEAELQDASRAQTWELLVAELVPPAAGRLPCARGPPAGPGRERPGRGHGPGAAAARARSCWMPSRRSRAGAGVTELKVVVRPG